MLTELRARKMAAFFHAADENKDGVLEYADYEKLLQNVADLRGWQPGTPEYQNLTQAYMSVWQQGVAKLTLPEYLAIWEAALAMPQVADMNRAVSNLVFGILDHDHDDKISNVEYAEYLSAHHLDTPTADQAFKHMDTDGDGIITRAQFAQLSADFFFSDDETAPGNWLWGSY